MNLVALGKDFLYLVGNDGIEAAAEGVQFNEFQVLMLHDVLRCPIETGMIGPLVDDAEVAVKLPKVGDTVFTEDGESQAVNELRNAVVDFRIDVIRTAAKDDCSVAGLLEVV